MHKAFEITVLGTSSASPTKSRHPSAHFVRMEGDYFLLDCGEGTQLQLVRHGLRMQRIKYILITHLHGDHFFGLPGLITSMALHGRQESLIIAGPKELKKILTDILTIGDAKLPFELEFIVCENEKSAIILNSPNWEIATVPLKHRVPCTGFILRETGSELKLNAEACETLGIPVSAYEGIKAGYDYIDADGKKTENQLLTFPGNKNRSYAYITDTVYDENIAHSIAGADLLYHECTFLHELLRRAEETMHCTALQAGQMAKLAQAKQLMIGHFSARYHTTDDLLAETKSVFENTIVAEEGTTYFL